MDVTPSTTPARVNERMIVLVIRSHLPANSCLHKLGKFVCFSLFRRNIRSPRRCSWNRQTESELPRLCLDLLIIQFVAHAQHDKTRRVYYDQFYMLIRGVVSRVSESCASRIIRPSRSTLLPFARPETRATFNFRNGWPIRGARCHGRTRSFAARFLRP